MSISVDIRKDFGAFKLNVQFEAGNEVLGILGASGCGKSMTLKCIAGVVKPDSGRIVLDGRTLYDSKRHINLPPQQRRIGMLFQNYALFPNMTVLQNIMAGCEKADRPARVQEVLAKFRLQGLEKHKPAQLSGGQQQRVALARIFVTKPKILLLDEPFSALDSFLRWELEMELAQRIREFGATTLLVSHDRDEIHRLCDSVCVLSNGTNELCVRVRDLFKNPRSFAAAQLSGCKNISRASYVSENEVFAQDWGVRFHSAKPVPKDIRYVAIRAKDILLAKEGDRENVLHCAVETHFEELFYHIYMLRPLKSENEPTRSIRLDIEKHFPPLPPNAKTVRIKITADNLLFLNK
ncbi:MAG: ATP-binding cassette domain-containing protein [Oscillospiraceae bacterium]|jgi:molybdate transport system ATP-binding protein|nr:ATP-binding cassette domain-containing protein [Oscillospiraceae bacterium]